MGIFGSESIASEVLHGKRELTRATYQAAERQVRCIPGGVLLMSGFVLLPLLKPVQKREHQQPNHRIRQGRDRHVAPAPLLRLPQQAMGHAVVDPLVQDEKDIGDEEPRARILDVNLHPQRRSQVSDDGQRNSVHAQRVVRTGEQVLQQPDNASGEAAADRVAARHREEDGHHERQVNDREVADPHRNEDLDQERDQRDEDDRRPAEVVDRDLLP